MVDPQRLRGLAPESCLGGSDVIEIDVPAIRDIVHDLGLLSLAPAERAVRAFAWVRDEIQYEFMAKLSRAQYVTSHVLALREGFCVQKAMVLCALGRAAKVPTALVLSDLRDRSLHPKMVKALGTDVMFQHGLNAFHLEDRWLLADASLSPELCHRNRYRLVELDGKADALMAKTTLDGKPHAEYVRFHGMYADLPFEQLVSTWATAYVDADVLALAELGYQL